MEIVYCGGCGKALRGDDFSRGLARVVDHRPWCAECKPPDKGPVAPAAATPSWKQSSSSRTPRAGTARTEAAPPAGGQKNLLIGGSIAVLVLVVAGIAMSAGGSTPPVERARAPVDPPKRGPDPAEAARALKDLEVFASLSTPDQILARCDLLRPSLIGTAQAKRFLEIESAAKDQKHARDLDLQLAKDLESLKKLIADDARYAKADEVERRFKALRDSAGARAAEIDRLRTEYRRDLQSSPHERREGPFLEDEEGFIRNWLVLGVFPNDKDKGLETDFLKTEAAADPIAGGAVGKVKWAPHASAESKVDFFRVSSLNIKRPKDNVVAYAYCVIQVLEQVAAEIRVGSDDAQFLWVDGLQVGKTHKARAFKVDDDRYPMPLSPGLHRLLIKVENHSKEFEFAVRIVTPDGKPIPSLRFWN